MSGSGAGRFTWVGVRASLRWLLQASILLPLLVALLLRVCLLLLALHATGTVAVTAGDSASYLLPARELLHRGCFCVGGQPEMDRTPGYPIFAIATGAASGHLLPLLLVQILLSVASLVLVARLAEVLTGSHRAAVATAWLQAVELLSAEHAIRVLSETLFAFLLVVLLLALRRWLDFRSLEFRLLEWPGLSWPLAAALLLAAMAYVRPVALVFALPLAVAVPLLQAHPGKGGMRRRWAHGMLFLLVFAAAVLPWTLRNRAVGGYTGFSAVASRNLYFYIAGDAMAQAQHLSLEQWQQQVGKDDPARWLQLHPELQGSSVAAQSQWLHRQAMREIAAHPGRVAQSWLRGELRLLMAPGTTQQFRLLAVPFGSAWRWPVEAAFAGYLVLVYGLAALAVARRRIAMPQLVLLLLMVAGFLAVSGGGQAISRLRLPAMPILCLLAGSSFAEPRRAAVLQP